jgi:site-specific DNA-methyltransferase (adenine-specific)|tara:strand:- start:569 stop:1153 length:585 start_codon:yes stop_codon:yes gene_type:complete
MARYEDNYFDLAIVDPPYGIGNFIPQNRINGKFDKVEWNDTIPNKEYFKELKRVSKERIIWGANYYNCFNDKGGAIVWFKDVRHPNMSKCEIASYSRLKKVDFYRYDWSNTDKYNELRGADIHPCEKPVSLYEWLLINYAKKGDKILDTHLGSGSIAIACHNLGFELTACELDNEYYNAAIKRIEQHKAQKRIF